MSTFDIETLRIRAGIDPADASRDADLEDAAAQALALCETYCDRWFELKDETEQAYPTTGGAYIVKRYPITSITSITDANGESFDVSLVRTVDAAGIVLRGGGGGVPVTIEYRGGFDPLPKDLQFAILAAFDVVWSTTPGFGVAGGANAAASTVAKISVVGVGSIDFGGAASGGGDRFAADVAPWGALPVAVTAVLNRYLHHTVIGGG